MDTKLLISKHVKTTNNLDLLREFCLRAGLGCVCVCACMRACVRACANYIAKNQRTGQSSGVK